jgi:hypothetical protein
MNLRLRDSDVTPDLGLVGEPTDPQARRPHQPAEAGEVLDGA